MKRLLSILLLSFILAFQAADAVPMAASTAYVLNTNTKKFHWPQCASVSQMKEKNRQDTTMSYDEIIEKGYVPCKNCNPSREDIISGAKPEGRDLKTSLNAARESARQAGGVNGSQAAGLISGDRTAEITYVVNINTRKFHYPTCSSVSDMKEKNRQDSTKTREQLVEEGFVPCKRCNP